MQVEFSLTWNDIHKGQRWHPDKCPVAISVSRQLGRRVRMETHRIRLVGECERRLPVRVKNFIRDFDADISERIKPFTFCLYVPKQYVRQSFRKSHKSRKAA